MVNKKRAEARFVRSSHSGEFAVALLELLATPAGARFIASHRTKSLLQARQIGRHGLRLSGFVPDVGLHAEQVDDADGGIRKEVGATGARFGYALTRAGNGGVEQRVAVIGDADFLANSYLGNGGNLQLGLALVRWLTGADAMVGIATRDAPDLRLELSQATMLVIALGALFGMPLLLLATGLIIRTRRRQR